MLRTTIFLGLILIAVVALGARNKDKDQAKGLNWKMVEKGAQVIEKL